MYKTELQIEGMACGMCEAHINEAIRESFSVKKVKSSHKKGLTVITSAERLDEEKLRDVVGATGYGLLGVNVREE